MDRGARQATVHGVAESWTQLSDSHFHFHHTVLGGKNSDPHGINSEHKAQRRVSRKVSRLVGDRSESVHFQS